MLSLCDSNMVELLFAASLDTFLLLLVVLEGVTKTKAQRFFKEARSFV